MASDREMLLRVRDELRGKESGFALRLMINDHLNTPQPTNNTIEAWLACDGNGCAGVYEIDPQWDAENHEFEWADGWFFSFTDDGFDAIFPHVEPGHKVKVRLTVDPIGEPIKCNKPEPVWSIKDEPHIGTTTVVSRISMVDCYRIFGRDHAKRAAELCATLNSKES